jgi:hypothetical protein
VVGEILEALKHNPDAVYATSKMLFYHTPKIIDRSGDVYTTAATALLRGRGEPSENYKEPEWVYIHNMPGSLINKTISIIKKINPKKFIFSDHILLSRLMNKVISI